MTTKHRAVILILLVAAGSAGIVALAVFSYTFSCSSGSLPAVHFTIIESTLGYNNSKDHASPWPVISVHCGQLVTIHVQNNDTTEAHGFEIDHYLDHEVVLGPGESYDAVFNATVQGSFRFFCTIPCLVHQFMLNGQLNVVK